MCVAQTHNIFFFSSAALKDFSIFTTAELCLQPRSECACFAESSSVGGGSTFSLTCLQSEASRLRLLVEMVRLIVMPANCRLLFPRMEVRHREVGCKGQQVGFKNKRQKQTERNRPPKNIEISVSIILYFNATRHRSLSSARWLRAGMWVYMCGKVGEQLQL